MTNNKTVKKHKKRKKVKFKFKKIDKEKKIKIIRIIMLCLILLLIEIDIISICFFTFSALNTQINNFLKENLNNNKPTINLFYIIGIFGSLIISVFSSRFITNRLSEISSNWNTINLLLLLLGIIAVNIAVLSLIGTNKAL